MRHEDIAKSIQELARQYDIPFEPDDAPLKWQGSPATARSQGSWDPDSQTWASKGKGKERAPDSPRMLAKKQLQVFTNSLNSNLCHNVPSLFRGNPLAVRHHKQSNVKRDVLHISDSAVSSPPPPPSPLHPPPKDQIELDSDQTQDTRTLSEDESTVLLESSEASFYIEVEPDTSELPHVSHMVTTSKPKHIDGEERRRQHEHALQEANQAAVKVHQALNHATLQCRVEELGRRIEQEGELRRKAETAKAEAEERLASLHHRLDLERQERMTLLDQLHERVCDRSMQDATTRAWTLIEAALGIVGHEFVSDESSGEGDNAIMEDSRTINRQTADAADEAGGGKKPNEVRLSSRWIPQEVGVVKNKAVEQQSRYSRPHVQTLPDQTYEIGSIKEQVVDKHSYSRYSGTLGDKMLKGTPEIALVKKQTVEQQSRYSRPLAKALLKESQDCGEPQSRYSRPLVRCHSGQVNKQIGEQQSRYSRTLVQSHSKESLAKEVRHNTQSAASTTRTTSDASTCRSQRTCSSPSSDRSLNAPVACSASKANARASLIIAPGPQNLEELFKPFFHTHVRASTPPREESPCRSPPRTLIESLSRSTLGSPQRTLVVDGRSSSPQPGLTSPFRAQGRTSGNENSNSRMFGRQVLESMRSASPPPTSPARHVFQGAFPCLPERNQGWPAARPC